MAQASASSLPALARGFFQLSNARKIGLIATVAAVISLGVVLFTYTRIPEYRVLFANVSDKDGGAVIAALSQMNVPYRMADGGGAILVPSGMVYETRLKLASQGLPRGGGVGFEILETQKFGVSQFIEQVNYQRAIEGELARTIQSLSAVQSARVHLAIPRPSVFVRENQKPSASVLVSLYAGRSLDSAQISGMVNLISSSVPELSPRNVTVVDQNGNLLSGPTGDTGRGTLDATQLKYLNQVETTVARRIESILGPITGPENVRAQVAASLDFSETEQTSESFKPNANPRDQSIRSQQSNESNSTTPQAAQGVPGALSNQPPGAASAPLVTPQPGAPPGNQPPPPATSTQKEQTVNFEVDKTIRHTKGEVGSIKRLSVAVVVNYRRVGEGAKAKQEPLSEQEITQINDLAREAMGFSKERGDTLNVVNAPFRAGAAEEAAAAAVPFWKDPWLISLALSAVKWIGFVGFAFVALLMMRSAVRDLVRLGATPEPAAAGAGGAGGATFQGGFQGGSPEAQQAAQAQQGYDGDLRAVREMAKQDPAIVAQVVKGWVGRDE